MQEHGHPDPGEEPIYSMSTTHTGRSIQFLGSMHDLLLSLRYQSPPFSCFPSLLPATHGLATGVVGHPSHRTPQQHIS